MSTLTKVLRPFADGITTGYAQSGVGTHAADLDDTAVQPTAPSTASYVLTDSDTDLTDEEIILDQNNFEIGNIDQIVAWVYCEDSNGTPPDLTVDLKVGGSYLGTLDLTPPSPASWLSFTWNGDWITSDLNDLTFKFTSPSFGSNDEITIYALYCLVYYFPKQHT